jgi:hypothetical protein
MFCQCKGPDRRGHCAVVVLFASGARLFFAFATNQRRRDRQRCEELAMDFVARIGGKDDFDLMEIRNDQRATFEPQ